MLKRTKPNKSKKWLKKLSILVCVILFMLTLSACILDPFYAYRVRDDAYLLNVKFSSPGLIKNHKYNAAIIGSSMFQNFDIPIFREKLEINPLKIAFGGASLSDIIYINRLFIKTGKANAYYINLDIEAFASIEQSEKSDNSLFPIYLMDSNALNDYRYLLGFETWMRYIPISLAMMTLDILSIKVPEKFDTRRSIDKLAEWRNDFKCGRDIVINNYKNKKYQVSQINTDELYDRLVKNADWFFSQIDFSTGDYIFVFPPYSALYWYESVQQGYYHQFKDIKQYIAEKLSNYKNVKIFDFQSAEFIVDLNFYKDTTHFCGGISDWMVDHFADNEYQVDSESIIVNLKILDDLVEQFTKNNREWLEAE